MGTRTQSQAVRDVIETNTDVNMDSFIRTANTVTNNVAANDSGGLLDDATLYEIETYLAAHFYALFDFQYAEKETGKAQAKFQGEFGKRFESTYWGQMALTLDTTGYLDKMNKPVTKATFTWGGKPPSEQIDYRDRD